MPHTLGVWVFILLMTKFGKARKIRLSGFALF
jgi:hypothetical protein